MRRSTVHGVLLGGTLLLGCGAWVPRMAHTEPRGTPARGYLLGGSPLPDRGEGFVRVRPGEPTRWGTPTLVEGIQRAAAEVERRFPGGPPLRVGDLSSPGGGRHPRHRSHRNGLDADLLPYLETPWGRPLHAKGWPRVGPFGWLRPWPSTRGRLDTHRTWWLLRTLMRTLPVQWVFCSRAMKAALLRHAARYEPNPRLLARAAWVLLAPRRVDPHEDHVHLRLACSAEERTLGCRQQPPFWPWLRGPDDAKGGWPEARPNIWADGVGRDRRTRGSKAPHDSSKQATR